MDGLPPDLPVAARPGPAAHAEGVDRLRRHRAAFRAAGVTDSAPGPRRPRHRLPPHRPRPQHPGPVRPRGGRAAGDHPGVAGDARGTRRHRRACDGCARRDGRRQRAGRAGRAGSADPGRLGGTFRVPARLRRYRRTGPAAGDDRGPPAGARRRRRRFRRTAPGRGGPARPRGRMLDMALSIDFAAPGDRAAGDCAASLARQLPP